jgi:hypothetical protein
LKEFGDAKPQPTTGQFLWFSMQPLKISILPVALQAAAKSLVIAA